MVHYEALVLLYHSSHSHAIPYTPYTNNNLPILLSDIAGKYSDKTGLSVCTSAESGSYVGVNGAKSTTKCSAGSYISIAGDTASSSSVLCPTGKFSVAGQSVCTDCLAGTFAKDTGSTVCTTCDAGEYSNEGKDSCIKASPGYWVDAGKGQGSQAPVSAGCYGSTPGASTACPNKAPIGYYIGTAGATVGKNTPCNPGTFSNIVGASVCKPCSAGYFQLVLVISNHSRVKASVILLSVDIMFLLLVLHLLSQHLLVPILEMLPLLMQVKCVLLVLILIELARSNVHHAQLVNSQVLVPSLVVVAQVVHTHNPIPLHVFVPLLVTM